MKYPDILMKTWYLLVIFLMCTVLQATHPVSVGIAMGVNSSDYWGSDADNISADFNLERNEQHAFITLTAENLDNSEKESSKLHEVGEVSIIRKTFIDYLEFAGAGKYMIIPDNPFSLQLGVYGAWAITEIPRKLDYGLMFGVGLEFEKFFLDVRHQMGFRDLDTNLSLKTKTTYLRIGVKFTFMQKDLWD